MNGKIQNEVAADAQGKSVASAPLRVAYVLLWFPLSSETFVFREISELRRQGLNVSVHTLYGLSLKGVSREMRDYDGSVARMGVGSFFGIIRAFARRLMNSPAQTVGLIREGLFRRMRNIEAQGENLWSFLAGFLLAERCAAEKSDLIHSAWANGPATAAWVASKLTGIPFAFTGRAGDIYPEDGILREKSRDALFIRVNNAANLEWLAKFCPPEQRNKIALVYNGLTFPRGKAKKKKRAARPPRILAVGRFARTKGFPDLLAALARLKRENFPASLTLVGDGSWKRKLLAMRKRLGLEKIVDMPGFVPNDRLREIMEDSDLLVVPSVVHGNGDRDGIPNVIMEALSTGLPVVATDVCGISEVVTDGVTGRLVPQRDPRALAGAIRESLERYSESLAMAEAGRKKVEKMFDPVINARALIDLYSTALRRAANG